MKITEIITESKLVKYDDQLSLDVKVDGQTVDIRAIVDGKQVGSVVFDRDGKTLIADMLEVVGEYRRQGIATKMYDYVKSLGFTVKRSDNQLSRGKLFWDKRKGEDVNVWEQEDPIDEMALSKYQTFGDFNKPGPFTGVDKKLVPHPKNIQKATTFFEQTPYDFRLFFANISGLGKYRETGPVSPEQLRQIFNKEQADEIINGSEDTITVIYVNNVGDRKVMMTPWIMAHRFGHAINAGSERDSTWNSWKEVEQHFFSQINQILAEYYGSPTVIVALNYAREMPKSPWYVVGALITEKSPKIDNYYNQNVYSVMSIGVEPEMRGQGIARHLYDGYLLPPPDGLDSILFSGDSQTTGGRAMWTNLKSRPDIEVTGYVKVPNWMPEYSDQQMITFFNKVGGAYLGHLGTDWYFEFPVEKLPNKRELEIAIKGSGVKVYSGNAETGLMARYLG